MRRDKVYWFKTFKSFKPFKPFQALQPFKPMEDKSRVMSMYAVRAS